ncbi:hypothetical protein COCNU_02G003170 [Cocos nucifera]|uniref:DUF4283 domain-containing protein n=1 Tax=Cocos nucifera TaxID=13894 RepID=A0A8K0MWN3_COCNU|nr:hypothetical protein COCNU_02G003170 [Cocos nucifera]
MVGISAYLDRAAKVKTFGRQVKADDVAGILEQGAWKSGSWFTRQVAPRRFFVSCPDKKIVVALMAKRYIRGDGFTVIINHWNQFSGGVRHKLRYKVYATLKDLPLFCWTAEAVAGIISGFAVPHRASRTSLRWDDLTGFDIIFFCEDISSIPKKVEVTVGSRTYSVGIVINFITEQGPPFDGWNSEQQEDHNEMDDDEWKFWNGPGGRSLLNDSWRYHQQHPEDSQVAEYGNRGRNTR